MRRWLVLCAVMLAWIGVPRTSAAANLCVKTGGTNATAKVSINYVAGNESASACWKGLGRALWGSTTRSAPVSGEAAAAGDTVYVFGATYNDDNSLNCSPTIGTCRKTVLYEPTNSGSSGNYISIVCIGTCLVTAQDWNGPAVGTASATYVKWYADVSLGYSWQLNGYSVSDDNASATQIDTTPDTGVALCQGTGCWLEGFDIDGGPDMDVFDNYTGIRVELCTSCRIRNNRIRSIHAPQSHGVGIETYHSPDLLIEHNDISDVDAGIVHKNNPDLSGTSSGIVRLNLVTAPDQACFVWSINRTGHEDGIITSQNVCQNPVQIAFFFAGSYVTNDLIANNTVYNAPDFLYNKLAAANLNGVRMWNNISHTTTHAIESETTWASADTSIDFEHTVYASNSGDFYTGSDGTLATLAAFNSAHAGQNTDAAASTSSDPRLANASGGDFRLCTAVALPNASCVGASPALTLGTDAADVDSDSNTTETIAAGAYVTGSEHIGLDTTGTVISSGPILPQFSRKLRKVN